MKLKTKFLIWFSVSILLVVIGVMLSDISESISYLCLSFGCLFSGFVVGIMAEKGYIGEDN